MNYVHIMPGGTKFHYDTDYQGLHNHFGPAVEYPWGEKKWFLYGKQHRAALPAYEYPNSAANTKEYWFSHARGANAIAMGKWAWETKDGVYTEREPNGTERDYKNGLLIAKRNQNKP